MYKIFTVLRIYIQSVLNIRTEYFGYMYEVL